MASIIPFPLHRVTPPRDSASADTAHDDTGSENTLGEVSELPPVPVEDLREKIAAIEATAPEESAESIVALPDRAQKRAKNIALHQLGVSGRSEAEVRERLASRDIEQDVIDQEISRLIEVGLIDDVALASDLVDTLRRRKKLGDTAISHALRRRKIPQDVILQVMSDSEFDSDVAIYELATERARALAHHDHDVAYRRLVGFIQRRGYGGPQVFDAARRALDAVSGD